MKRNIYIFLLLLLLPAAAFAQWPGWTSYTTGNSGLPNDLILCFAYDDQQNLWIGTSGGGLAKFDGVNWTVYNTSNSGIIANHDVSALAVDAEQNVWVGTQVGLSKFNGANWVEYTTANSGLPNNDIDEIKIDDNQNIWITTYGGGLAKFTGTTWTVYNTSNSGLPYDYLSSLAIDASQNIWIGTYGGGLAKFNGTTWTVFNTSNSGLLSNDIRSIAIDASQNVWVGTEGGGLAKFIGTTWTVYTTANSDLPNNSIYALAVDADQDIWIGMWSGGGLTKFDGSHWTRYFTSNSGLNSDYVPALFLDPAQNIWVGTWWGGVNKLVPSQLLPQLITVTAPNGGETFHSRQSMDITWNASGTSSYLNLEYTSNNGRVWNLIANNVYYQSTPYSWSPPNTPSDSFLIRITDAGNTALKDVSNGVFSVTPNDPNWTIFNTANSGITKDSITAVYVHSDNKVYVGTNEGLAVYSPLTESSWTYYNHTNSGLISDYILSVSVDQYQTVWVGTLGGGLFKFDGTTWTQYTTANSSLPSNNVDAVYIDQNQAVWAGTRLGLVKISGSTWTVYKTSNSNIVGNYIRAITKDLAGNYWIGTTLGISKFNGTTWTNYQAAQGLPNINIYSIVVDGYNNIWAGTLGGLAKYDGTSWTSFTTDNSGLPENSIRSVAVDYLQNIWIATLSSGVVKFDGTAWQTYNMTNSDLSNNITNALTLDADQNVWIATVSAGLARYQTGNFAIRPTVTAGTFHALPAETLFVPIILSNAKNVGALSFELTFNPALVTFLDAANVSPLISELIYTAGTGMVTAAFEDLTGITSDSMKLFDLRFVYTSGTAPLSFTAARSELADIFSHPLPALFVDGSVLLDTGTPISGFIKYKNDAETPLNSTTVRFMKNGALIDSAETNASGFYTFPTLIHGSYIFQSGSSVPWGGVNSTDALALRRYVAGLRTLDALNILAADVNNSGTVTSADALLIRRRFAFVDSSFAKGDWVFETPSFLKEFRAQTQSMLGLCTGDLNASYIPGLPKQTPSVNAIAQGHVEITPGGNFLLPIYVSAGAPIGAVSLVFDYSASAFDITGITSRMEGLVYSAKNGRLTVAWDDLNGIPSNENEPLLKILVSAKETGTAEGLFFTLNPAESEIADIEANILSGAVLRMPELGLALPTEFRLSQNFPNPFNPSTTIEYDVPSEGNVRIEIFNSLGESVEVLMDAVQVPGRYTAVWNAKNFTSGVYFYRMTAETGTKNFTQVKKLMLVK